MTGDDEQGMTGPRLIETRRTYEYEGNEGPIVEDIWNRNEMRLKKLIVIDKPDEKAVHVEGRGWRVTKDGSRDKRGSAGETSDVTATRRIAEGLGLVPVYPQTYDAWAQEVRG